MSRRNYLFCRAGLDDFGKAIEEIRKTIHTDYEWLKYHTQLQNKALAWERYDDNSRLFAGEKNYKKPKNNFLKSASRKILNQQFYNANIFLRVGILPNSIRWRIVWISVGVSLAMVVLAVFAIVQRNNALQQAQIALARQLVAQAQTINATRNSRQIIAVLLATRSMQILPSGEASQALLGNLTGHATYAINRSQEGEVRDVAFSPDSKLLASASGNTILIVETISGKEIVSMQQDDVVYSLAFSPDGKYIASGGRGQNGSNIGSSSWR